MSGQTARGSYSETARNGKGRTVVSRESYETSSSQIERWTYNCGEGDYIYILTFEAGTLKLIQSAGRGSGAGGCKGATSPPSSSSNYRPIPGSPSSLPEQEPRQQSNAKITVYGRPHNAIVELDGHFAGEMTCTIEDVPPGIHDLVVRHDNYRIWRKRIGVQTGQELYFQVYLEPEH